MDGKVGTIKGHGQESGAASPAASVAFGLFGFWRMYACLRAATRRGREKPLETLVAGWGNRGLGEVSLCLG